MSRLYAGCKSLPATESEVDRLRAWEITLIKNVLEHAEVPNYGKIFLDEHQRVYMHKKTLYTLLFEFSNKGRCKMWGHIEDLDNSFGQHDKKKIESLKDFHKEIEDSLAVPDDWLERPWILKPRG